MKTLTYAGPKVSISSHGVDFDLNKEDKFIYLSIVVELIQALNHEYLDGKCYTYLTSGKPLCDDLLLPVLVAHDPLLEEKLNEREKITQNEIDDDLKRAHSNPLLCIEEREALLKNLELMRQYRISRALNKTAYYSGIDTIAKIIHDIHIDYIASDMYPKFMHVFHSIQGALKKLHPAIESDIDIFSHDHQLRIQLNIKYI